MNRGVLITIEGLDGAGKTTLAQALARELHRRGTRVELLREPGGVAASERIRELVKDPAITLGAAAEALLYAAARAQLVEEQVRPLLDAGALVLLDRFVDSSLAYQGAGRELGVERVRAINELATGGLQPDLTILLRISPTVGRARCAERTAGNPTARGDRLERESEEFFTRIAHAYDELAREDPQRFLAIDAERPPTEVLAQSLEAVGDLIDSPH